MDGLLWRSLERTFWPGCVGVFVEHFHKCFLLELLTSQQGLRSGVGAKLPEPRLPAQWTGRGPVNESIMFGKLSNFLLFFFFLFFEECA